MRAVLKSLPPVTSLRPFEAAARHLSFSKAADEICVTQAAVSKQVRFLEEHLGCSLFHRKGRRVELTSEGHALWQAVSHGLGHIADTAHAIGTRQTTNRVSIGMRLAFASQFMASRLAAFREAFPEVDLAIVTTQRNPVQLAHTVDLVVSLGEAAQTGMVADHLFTEEVFPVCSPGYLTAHPDLSGAGDLAGQNLIHLRHDHWHDLIWDPIDWTVLGRAFGVELGSTGISFDNFELMLSAAVGGLGVAVGWRHLVADAMAEGHLVRAIPDTLHVERRHFLLSHADRADDPVIRALRAWLMAQTEFLRE